MKGATLPLAGREVNVGDEAPDFTAVTTDLQPMSLSSLRGQTVVLVSVPSLDTSVCDLETRRFDKEAGQMAPGIRIVVISMDLPFAQKRWCGAAQARNIVTVSDHRDASFGKAYGVLIPELRLLARAIFVVDPDGKIAYKQIVPEVTHEPNYTEVLDAVKQVAA
jgi:thiol peroxidase